MQDRYDTKRIVELARKIEQLQGQIDVLVEELRRAISSDSQPSQQRAFPFATPAPAVQSGKKLDRLLDSLEQNGQASVENLSVLLYGDGEGNNKKLVRALLAYAKRKGYIEKVAGGWQVTGSAKTRKVT
jgi:hypothetical protein